MSSLNLIFIMFKCIAKDKQYDFLSPKSLTNFILPSS